MTKTLQSNQQSEVDAESVPSSLRIVCDDASSINLQAAEAAEEGKPALRKFSMVAYTGGAMRLGGWPYPVVVDLAGMRVTRKSRPILKDHDRASIVGHTDDIMVGDSRLEVAGVISGVGNTAQEVIATSENGFPWQASLGANADKVVFIPEGKTATANSREFKGPVYIARKSTLGEVSFGLGADDDTEARSRLAKLRATMTSMAMSQTRTTPSLTIRNSTQSTQVSNCLPNQSGRIPMELFPRCVSKPPLNPNESPASARFALASIRRSKLARLKKAGVYQNGVGSATNRTTQGP